MSHSGIVKREERLKQIDRLILKIRSELDYQKFLTPSNFEYENQHFLECYNRGEEYNPQYKYNKFYLSKEYESAIKAIVEEMKQYEGGVGQILYMASESLEREIGLYYAIGDDNCFSKICNEIYGTPDTDLIVQAEWILRKTAINEEPGCYTAEDLLEMFSQRLKLYNFDWKIVISSDMASRVSVEPEQKTIYIKQGSIFTRNDAIRLKVHEIDTHILRCENGAKRGYFVFSSGTFGSLIHEEGLALYNEFKNNVQDPSTARLYAARFIACCNINKSFFELFDMLVYYGCSQKQAMYVVSRIKRGISDTSKPGGFIKDYVYFQGFYEIKRFLEINSDCYTRLYYGSISVSDLARLSEEIETETASGNILLPHVDGI